MNSPTSPLCARCGAKVDPFDYRIDTEPSDLLCVACANGARLVFVPMSIVRNLQLDDSSIAKLYGARYVRSIRSGSWYRFSPEGLELLRDDMTLAESGHWDGGTPQENAGIVRSSRSFGRKLDAVLAK